LAIVGDLARSIRRFSLDPSKALLVSILDLLQINSPTLSKPIQSCITQQLSYTAKNSIIVEQVAAYQKRECHISNYRKILVLSFGEEADEVFQNLRPQYPRLGTMDLKIDAIAIASQSTLLTRNTKDFSQTRTLSVEDRTT
jgi:predicted nucleic acid-binding protein